MGSRLPNTRLSPTKSKFKVSYGKTIETTVTSESVVADEWVREIRFKYGAENLVMVGLGCKPVSIPGSKAAILRICVQDKCLILQLLYMDKFPVSLKSFFMDSKFIFIGFDVESYIKKLSDEYDICFEPLDFVELGDYGEQSALFLKKLAMSLCGVDLEKRKRVCTSNWEVETLSKEQVEYACLDAYTSFCVGHEFHVGAEPFAELIADLAGL